MASLEEISELCLPSLFPTTCHYKKPWKELAASEGGGGLTP